MKKETINLIDSIISNKKEIIETYYNSFLTNFQNNKIIMLNNIPQSILNLKLSNFIDNQKHNKILFSEKIKQKSIKSKKEYNTSRKKINNFKVDNFEFIKKEINNINIGKKSKSPINKGKLIKWKF